MNIIHEGITADWTDFPTRVVTAVIGAPIAVMAIVWGGPLFAVLMFTLAALAAYEVSEVIGAGRGVFFVGVLGVMVLVAYATPYVFLLPLLLVLVSVMGSARRQTPHTAFYTFVGVLYVALPLSLALVIRESANGLLWIMALTWSVWATDTMALVGGRLMGRHKLAPLISPGKTIEGALVGVLFGIGMGMAILMLFGQSVFVAMSLSMTASSMAILGDLFESWMKRHFNVKDAGSILPGHGGMTDRIDSILAALPVFYLLLLAFGLL